MSQTPPRHAHSPRTHRVRHAVALALTGVLTLGAASAAAVYLDLQASIETSDVDDVLAGRDRPTPQPADPDDPYAGRELNILVMGTDFRGEGIDAIAGAGDEFHSDSTLVVHVSGDRRWIEVVSIPRDSLVDIPACPLPGGGESRPQRDTMFNTAFAIGGGPEKDITYAAACTVLTVEALTGVAITDHVVVKMNGVTPVVDAIGGVRMCFPEPVEGDEHVDLHLPAGEHTVTGYEAINFLRARGGTGLGLEIRSDLERIKRQQAFVDSMLRQVLSQNIITDAPSLYRLVEAVLRSINTSPQLGSIDALAGLAWSLRNIDTANIVFTPLAVRDDPRNPNRVLWVTSETDPLWARIAAGDPPPSVAPSPPSDDGGATGAATGAATSDPTDGAGTGGETGTDPGVGGGSGSAGGGTAGSGADEPTTPPAEPSPEPSLLPGVCPP